jgi:hypothetical protein
VSAGSVGVTPAPDISTRQGAPLRTNEKPCGALRGDPHHTWLRLIDSPSGTLALGELGPVGVDEVAYGDHEAAEVFGP